MAEIQITPRARDWLSQHNGVVTIRTSPRHGCCGGSAAVPVAEPGVPRDTATYVRQDLDGLTVYLAPEVQGADNFIIRLESLFGLKRLFVEGAGLTAVKE